MRLPLQHVKLHGHKALKSVILSDLKKINVLCGKNNSGKSTIVEALSQKGTMNYGVTSSPDEFEDVFERCVASAPLGQYMDTHYRHMFRNFVFLPTLQKQGVWFDDEVEIFLQEFTLRYSSKGEFARLQVPRAEVKTGFNAAFSTRPSCFLIPPKRQLDFYPQVFSERAIKSDGGGLLSYLFYAKNQPNKSAESKFLASVKRNFQEISSGFVFETFQTPQDAIRLSFRLGDQDTIPAEDSGLGLQDLLLIVSCAHLPEHQVIIVEEPENHIHPEMQRRLLKFFHETPEKQFFISTHSNVFLDSTYVDKVWLTTCEGEVKLEDATSRAVALGSLGYSVTDNLTSDVIVLTEGPKDVLALNEFLRKMDIIPKYNVKFWPLGGDIMDQADLTVFIESYNVIALIDRDPGSAKIRKKFMDNCAALNIEVHKLERRALENYFTLDALREVFGSDIPESVESINSKTKLEGQIGINVKRNAGQISRVMKLEDIEKTDLFEFLKRVKCLCETNPTNLMSEVE